MAANCDEQGISILSQFQQYKMFCMNQISDISQEDKDLKIRFMSKIIDDLMEQNQILLEVMLETQQSSKQKSIQMQQLLETTANKTFHIGMVLTSYELEIKKISQQNIPAFLKYSELFDDLHCYTKSLERENCQLKKENEQFFKNIQYQNLELMQYKNTIYCYQFDRPLRTGKLKQIENDNDRNVGYLEFVIKEKLDEEIENVNAIVCVNVLEELVSIVELDSEMPSNDDSFFDDVVDDNEIFSSNKLKRTNQTNNNKLQCYDINYNYELENDDTEIECDPILTDALSTNHCRQSIVNNLCYDFSNSNRSSNSTIISNSGFNEYGPQMLNIISMVLTELELYNSVIFNLKRQLSALQNKYHTLQKKFDLREEQIKQFKQMLNTNEQHHSTMTMMTAMKTNLSEEINNLIKAT